MADDTSAAAPSLSPVQLAWLRELGIDKQWLARFPDRGAMEEAATVAGAATPRGQDSGQSGPAPEPEQTLMPIRTLVESLAAQHAPGADPAPAETMAGTAARTAAGKAAVGAGSEAAGKTADARIVSGDWAALQVQVAACEACPLCANRRQAVFGSGVAEAPAWMVIGEAPGEQDDREGLPFQGRAGVLLEAMLAAAGVQTGTQVFFTNLVKCRPMGNRTPQPEEVAACRPYLQRQIALLKPQRILVLGRLAAQALLNSDAEFESLRGRVHTFHSETGLEIPLIATYHPASLLSRPQHKAQAWRDLNLARALGAG